MATNSGVMMHAKTQATSIKKIKFSDAAFIV